MAWERRERGGCYYYRSRRIGGRVAKEYVGKGRLAQFVADQDARLRQRRKAELAIQRAEGQRLNELDRSTGEVCREIGFVMRTALIGAGYHTHRGEWRQRRGG